MGLDEPGSPPRIEAWNKLDLLTGDAREALLNEAARRDDVVTLSALYGEGVEALRAAISERLQKGGTIHHLKLSAGDGTRLAWLHARGDVLDQRSEGETMHLAVKLSAENWARFQSL